ncbi:MAG TPA: serine/threonine-protein kinase, partial [Chroococcidiopsis sp.]
MSLCINPFCPEPDHYKNDGSRFCQSCGSDLILQDRYRVLRLISDKSGFGKIYEAYERSTPKLLKVLKDDHNDNEKAVELFQQEAEVLSQLHHPGIPLIEPHGYFQFLPRNGEGVLHCIIMEKIDGPNLREWMKQQGNHPIGEVQALQWLKQAAEVLHLVHSKNYFHRDIKPENIMLRSNGQLVLVDFGAAREMTYTYLAQLSGGTSGVTRISSAGYTPPEQEHGQAVPQSDFYALGRTFIYLLTGKLPTDTGIYDPMENEFHWRRHAPDLSPGFAALIDRLIAPKVSERPQNTEELLKAIASLEQEPRDRHPNLPTSSSANITTQSSNITQSPNITLSQPSALSRSRLWWSSSPRWLIAGLTAVVLSGGAVGGWLLYRMVLAPSVQMETVKAVRSLSGHSGNINALVLSPGEQTLVSASSDNTIKIWDFRTGQLERSLSGHSSFINAIAVSPDGQTIVSGSADKTVRLWNFQTGALLQTLEGHRSFVNAVLVSHTGQYVISGSADGQILIWDAQTGQVLRTLSSGSSAINALALSRDGQHLVSGSANGSLTVWDMDTGQEVSAIAAHTSPINALLISLNDR